MTAAQGHPELTPERVKVLTEDISEALVEEQEQAWPTPEPPAAIIAAERLSDALTTVRRLGTIRVTMVGGQPK